MNSHIPEIKKGLQPGGIAIIVVVLASFIIYFTDSSFKFNLQTTLILTGLGLIYTVLGTMVMQWVEERNNPKMKIGLILSMIITAGVFDFITYGITWLMLLPTASIIFVYFKRKWAMLFSIVIWILMVLPLAVFSGFNLVFSAGMSLLAAVVFVGAFTIITESERAARFELSNANQKLREYAAQAQELATVQERNRLAREIHDGLGHYLTAINIQLKAAQSTMSQENPQTVEAINNAQALTTEALADVRRSVSSLRQDPTSGKSLPTLIGNLLAENRASGSKIEFTITGSPRPLNPQADLALYRVAQESLTNVRKHASAAHVEIRLEYIEKEVILRIQDDGLGAEKTGSGFGLLGLKERLTLLGGDLQIETAPGKGFCVTANLPASNIQNL
jgi:signal transduction histidine kinase